MQMSFYLKKQQKIYIFDGSFEFFWWSLPLLMKCMFGKFRAVGLLLKKKNNPNQWFRYLCFAHPDYYIILDSQQSDAVLEGKIDLRERKVKQSQHLSAVATRIHWFCWLVILFHLFFIEESRS